jgi:hypothetical protein
MSNRVDPPSPKCPICGKDRVEAYRPFCSRRCADVDLNRWMSGRYAFPAEEAGEEESVPPAPGPDDTGQD